MNQLKNFILIILFLSISITSYADTYYVSNELGDDANSGELSSPFKTINRAIEEMETGDICEVMTGIYRERIEINNKPGITIRNYAGNEVLVTGLDKVLVPPNQDPENSNIVTVPFQQDPLPYILENDSYNGVNYIDGELIGVQVFYNGKRQNPARYPNEDGIMFSTSEWANSETFDTENNEAKVTITGLPSDILNNIGSTGFYIGLNTNNDSPFLAARGKVKRVDGNDIIVEPSSWAWKTGKQAVVGEGVGYLIGAYSLIDTSGEWYQDSDENTLYYQPNSISDFDYNKLEIRKRLYGLAILGSSDNVTIEGLHFKAASMIIDANNCNVNNCTFRYISPFVGTTPEEINTNHGVFYTEYGHRYNGTRGALIMGSGNIIKGSYFGASWRSLVNLHGSSNVIENCLLEDANWQAERSGALFCTGNNNTIKNNTIGLAARDGIDLGNFTPVLSGELSGVNNRLKSLATNTTIEGNSISNVCLLNTDCGCIYVNHQSQQRSHHTVIKNNLLSTGIRDIKLLTGVYLDNGSSGYTIHNNVIYDTKHGVRFNHNGENNKLYNNTIYNVDQGLIRVC